MWRVVTSVAVALPFTLAIAPADVSSMGTEVTKTTANGPVVGRVDGKGIERFFGIPTAADASGANRFRAPQPLSNWVSPRETVTERMCTHNHFDFEGVATFSGQEDCISVDVMTTTAAVGLPVFVYIHGGGFTTQDPPYSRVTNGYYQQATEGESRTAVSVFIHYRVGALGFLAHPGLTAETSHAGSGNWGLMDVITNLEWVRDNIANFGGDASRVTLVGESAGGTIAMMLSASPLTAGLFSNVIAQSPYMGGNFKAGTYGITARYEMASMFVSANGCSSGATASAIGVPIGTDAASEIACMRSVPAAMLEARTAQQAGTAFDAVYGAGAHGLVTYNGIQCWPVVDGHVLTQAPLDAWAAGVGAGVAFMIGMNSDEYTLFYPNPGRDYYRDSFQGITPFYSVDQAFVLAMDAVPLDATAQEWLDAIRTTSSDTTLTASIDAFYSDIPEHYPRVIQRVTDAWFVSALRLIVDTLTTQSARTSGTVYRYLFAQDPYSSVTSMWAGAMEHMGACHGCELTYVLGWYTDGHHYLAYGQGSPHTVSAAETTMGVTMKSFWLNMMYEGSPGTVGSSTWSASTASSRNTLVFKASLADGAALNPCLDTTTCRVESSNDYRAEASTFWQDPTGTANHPVSTAATCSAGMTGQTQAAAGYECGLPLLLNISIGLMGFFALLVLGTIAALMVKNGCLRNNADLAPPKSASV